MTVTAIAVTVIGGQSLCLFLTLLLVPVAYVKFDALEHFAVNKRWKEWVSRTKGGMFDKRRPVAGKV